MALQNIGLLKLLLAYSARHRAQVLGYPEPNKRITGLVSEVLYSLQRDLAFPLVVDNNATLATVLLMASLDIIAPKRLGLNDHWQYHLKGARRLVLDRCKNGYASNGTVTGSPKPKDKVNSFLMRWFAHLDIHGSLSCKAYGSPLPIDEYWPSDADSDDHFAIDCILGFTRHFAGILANIAKAINESKISAHYDARKFLAQADLLKPLEDSRMHCLTSCSDPDIHSPPTLEMDATNTAYHWAAYTYINAHTSYSGMVNRETAIREVLSTLYKVLPGGTAEACLLFPMFVTGCATWEPEQKDFVLERLKGMEILGVGHVSLVEYANCNFPLILVA